MLGAASIVNAACRTSLARLAPSALSPVQRICHCDNRGVPAGERMFACSLYLFEDASPGGTSVYRARCAPWEVEARVQDSRVLRGLAFEARQPELGRGYMVEDNDWCERVASARARFCRIALYDGGLFHLGGIRRPEGISVDPARGRLTINGFLRCIEDAPIVAG